MSEQDIIKSHLADKLKGDDELTSLLPNGADSIVIVCSTCHGTGIVPDDIFQIPFKHVLKTFGVDCPDCEGTGRIKG